LARVATMALCGVRRAVWADLARLHVLWVGREVAKGQRVPRNRLLKKTVKEHAPGARSSAVQAEGESIQVGLQVVGANRSLRGTISHLFRERRLGARLEHFVRIMPESLREVRWWA